MKKIHLIFALLCSFVLTNAQGIKIISPDGNLLLTVALNDAGAPTYSISYKTKPVILNSLLGLKLEDAPSLQNLFSIAAVDSSLIDNSWNPVWGEVKTIRNNYKMLQLHLVQNIQGGRKMNIEFRVFNDGVGFRYEFPLQTNLQHFVLKDELTQFHLAGNHKAFWIPGDYDSNEYFYYTTKLSEVDATKGDDITEISTRAIFNPNGVQTPLMMKTDDGLYINIHEAALVNYPAMQLQVDKSSFTLNCHLVPDVIGNKAYLQTPAVTPWRTIIVSDKATEILASKIILNLNEPSTIKDVSFIKPMKFVGVWWEMHVAKSTWDYAGTMDASNSGLKPSGKHGATTANTKRYIDFAAKNGIDGVLVEGWNVGWEDWFGKWKENVFDFITPYPDFNVQELQQYAASKGVKMIMHHETSASVTNYERYMDTAYRFMKQFGYPAVKTGYVGKIIPRGEHHDGQWMINHYNRVAAKTAAYQIMLDAHEPVRPTGLQRTYPNWMASEAARGNEFNAWSRGNPPEHETILPFTRLMGGPMDYTPGIFKIKMSYYNPSKKEQVHTTLVKQLALYITMYSPLQMAADLPENYEAHMDAFEFIKDVAVDWDDTKIIEAEPGDYITIARKAKGKDSWFIGSITDEQARASAILCDFLDKDKKYIATIYADGADAGWDTNPEAYKIDNFIVTNTTKIKLQLAAGGGCAISFKPATAEQTKQYKLYK